MKLNYKQRIFGFMFILFAFFSICIIISEQKQEKKYRTEALESKLDSYVEIIHQYIALNQSGDGNMAHVDELIKILPKEIRVTIINGEGNVLYDKDVANVKTLDNHLNRPEVRKAQYQDFGANIRMSSSTQHEYLYYAKYFQTYYIRVALPYSIETQSALKADNLFIYIVISLFIIVLFLVNIAANRFEKSITKLKDFTSRIKTGKPLPEDTKFPDDELGDISKELVHIFNEIEKNKRNVEVEREKLIQHFQYSEVGLCIFNAEFQKIYANTHFIQFLNLIANRPTFDVNSLFENDAFKPVLDFLNTRQKDHNYSASQYEVGGKILSIQVIVFDDKSFEITIRDITRIEKNRLLKQEMTNNIAHELRTPVTSLRGYLETLNEQHLPEDKQAFFISRAYLQSVRLSNLIEDVSLISKIEEAPAQFAMEQVNLSLLLDELRIDMASKLKENNIALSISVDNDLVIHGNYTLLYSIFRNLMDNSISYGGSNIEVHINNYMKDDKYVYFSFYDTGSGVPEQYLGRLFERFYRVNEGRTRDSGGSGLGLSIVKNAVLLHKGEIQVKNRLDGGLEFLFTLKR
ncbi:two-component sensor histidine kinase [Dysgonomonas sp. HDW5B]|uniref:sensor histidine kinase n=1 Tax=Dysgonomonas sp. HDW5B TaxID=2714927 RepID=UPI00140CF6D8|nr:ATP-binding protein [Dysgonomonas sp. HDW5B]QIK53613.1 two-component sensor histidine kinase [Dysgonomonas sp. HDW5B]